MSNKIDLMKAFSHIDTVVGTCEYCNEEAVLVAIVTDFIDVLIVAQTLNNISMVQ